MRFNTNEEYPLLSARIAGLLYLIIIVSGISSEVLIRSSLVVAGDATATATNILNYSGTFRIGFALDTLMLLCDVALAVILYFLLRNVSNILAMTAAAFRLIQASVLGMNLLNYFAALLVLERPGNAAIFEPDQLNEIAMLFLNMHSHGYDLGLLFFGISNLILGFLVIKSARFPGVLGWGLIAAGLVYLVGSLTRFLFPDYILFIQPIYIVPFLAELSFCLWLLLRGAKVRE